VTLALAAIVGILSGGLAARWVLARGRAVVDLPDERRLHQAPTPRGGGIGIPVAGLAAVALAWDPSVRLIAAWAAGNAILGWLDDRRSLPMRVKLGAQLLGATAVVLLGLRVDVVELPPWGPLPLGLAATPFTVLWLVWMTNVFNFMDGMDAFAAACGAVFFAALGAMAGTPALVALAAGSGGGLLGFLRYNTPPARIFMGDSGALFAGAALGGLCVAGAFTPSVLVLLPFLFDTTFTLGRRLWRGDPLVAHRTHLYQRLVLAGWPQGRVRALYLGYVLACAAAALAWPALSGVARAACVGTGLGVGALMVWLTSRVEMT
jgi:UDP-N-acetylmuramyl pentapeptide phosphotransferase/UDP-N-acetylglucosamine-1-phosphate transferase